MRWRSFLAVLAAIAGIAIATADTASAFGLDRSGPPEGWDRTRTVRHWVYWPHYRHVYRAATGDPFAYRYATRGYYPYYGSHYWVPAHQLKARTRTNYTLPRYHQAWGYPKHWDHVRWHRENHGFHHRWHW
jgi:hypothetical protein